MRALASSSSSSSRRRIAAAPQTTTTPALARGLQSGAWPIHRHSRRRPLVDSRLGAYTEGEDETVARASGVTTTTAPVPGPAAAADAADEPSPSDATTEQHQHQHPIAAFYGALSRRDLAALRDLLHPDVTYENLAVAGTSGPSALRGADSVVAFFADALSGVERGAAFEVDDWALQQQQRLSSPEADGGRAAAVWRLVSPTNAAAAAAAATTTTTTTTLARGVSFFRLSADGRLVAGVVDAPEHAVKTPRAGLAMAAPLAPAVQLLSESLASSLDALAAAAFGGGVGPAGGGNGGAASGASAAASAAASMAAAAAAAWASPSSGMNAPPQQPQQQPQQQQAEPAAPARDANAASAASTPTPPPPPPLEPLDPRLALSGLWQRDPSRTDMAALDASLELMGLGRLQRLTARLIDGVQVEVSASGGAAGQQQQLTVSFLTSVPVFRVTERVPLLPAAAADDGASSEQSWWAAELSGPRTARLSRRDLRPGRASAVARRRRPNPGAASSAEEQPVLEVRTQWGAPVAGGLRETYSVVGGGGEGGGGAPDELVVTAVTEVGGKSVTSRAVYVRARPGATAAEILAEGRRRSGGSLGEALKRQGL